VKKRSMNPLTKLYDQNNITNNRLRRDLSLFIYAASLGTIFFTVTGGTAFTGFSSALHATDLQYSILFGVPAAFSILQFLASWLMEKTRKRKTIFIVSGIIQRALWIPVALVPLFIPFSQPLLRLWLVVVLLSLSSVAAMFMNVTFFSWLGDIVPIHIRGRYLSLRYSIFTAMGLISAVVASIFLDMIPGITGYMYVFGVISLFGVADIVCFIWIHDPPMHVTQHEPFVKSLHGILKDKGFMLYLLFWTAWMFAWNLSGPFYSKYALDKLGISLTTTTLIGQVAYGVMAVVFVQWWGRKLDLHGHHWVLLRCGVVLCVLPLVWLFAKPGDIWPMLIASLGTGVFFCGIDVTSVQMLVSVTPLRNRSVFIAMYMVVTSLIGGSLANFAGGKILSILGELNFSFLGIQIDRYKLLFAGACILRALIVLLLLPLIANTKQHNQEDINVDQEERIGGNACKEPT
jgi:MFS family permease